MARQFGPREKSHDGKIRYHTRREAKRAARRIRRETGHRMEVYGCQFCGNWHLGHSRATRERDRRAKGGRFADDL